MESAKDDIYSSSLYIYVILHANLAFSSISRDQFANVIDHCYRPVLKIIREGFPVALEFPASTIIEIQKIDPVFIRELATLWQEKKCEVIGSTYIQSILPLQPKEVNIKNIQLGLDVYKELLGKKPELFFIPEQTMSKSLPEIIEPFNFKAIIMDWDNTAEHQDYKGEIRYSPVSITLSNGKKTNIIWNSSMNSYRFQRYIYGRISLQDLFQGLEKHKNDKNRAICLYGTDWEIFNFRPLTHEIFSNEVERMQTAFETLSLDKSMKLSLPSEIIDAIPPVENVEFTSSEVPIPCKNRDDYNITRWAVSGKDATDLNTLCFKNYQDISWINSFYKEQLPDDIWKDLASSWSSDFRTKTTNDKRLSSWQLQGKLHHQIEEIKSKTPLPESFQEFVLQNPAPDDFSNIYETELSFPEGLFNKFPSLWSDNKSIAVQFEDVKRYPDNSIRSFNIVFHSNIKALSQKTFLLKNMDDPSSFKNYTIRINGPEITLKTPETEIILNTNTGGDIRSLKFPLISDSPLIKYLHPVYFDNIAYSNDYYSSWSMALTEKGEIIHDTIPSSFSIKEVNGNIRIPVNFRHPFANGFIEKTYYIYINSPRIDLTNHFFFPDFSPFFLRTGITTINPEAFDINSLNFAAVNGASEAEFFPLKNHQISHHFSPNQSCSSLTCLGATEGWITIQDKKKGLAVFSNPGKSYSVPMIEFEEIRNLWLLRLYRSLYESDETGTPSIRGHKELSLTYEGFKGGTEYVRKKSGAFIHPLKVIHRSQIK